MEKLKFHYAFCPIFIVLCVCSKPGGMLYAVKEEGGILWKDGLSRQKY